MVARQFAVWVLVGLLTSCASSGARRAATSEALYVDPSTVDFDRSPGLLKRLEHSPHGYFRFVNIAFANEVCTEFKDVNARIPQVNLHGDAHLEQYAISDYGRGLTDFDDAASGPPMLDLMRFLVSIRLAARANGWEKRADDVSREFLRGYEDALADPEIVAPSPALADRVAKRFAESSHAYLSWIAEITRPVPAARALEIRRALDPYIATMQKEHGLPPEYFQVRATRRLSTGIGSALDRKYLLRIRGDTDEDGDDRVLELKQIRDISGIECLSGRTRRDPFRILVSQARIANQPYRFLGYVQLDEQYYWIHAWVENYEELDITRSFASADELSQVAYDVGAQLGRGHPKGIADPLGAQLREECGRVTHSLQGRLLKVAREMTERVYAAWHRFRDEAGSAPQADVTDSGAAKR